MFTNSINLNLLILSDKFIMKPYYDNFISNECVEVVEN